MRCYTHLDLDERRRLYQLIDSGRSARQAAVALGRHAATIYRELKRNRHRDEEPVFRGYFPVGAQGKAAARRLRGGKIIRRHELAAYVVDRLRAAWSPEQIASYLRRHRRDRLGVSHETIYSMSIVRSVVTKALASCSHRRDDRAAVAMRANREV